MKHEGTQILDFIATGQDIAAHLCELSNDAMALSAAIAHQRLDGRLAENEVFMCTNLHTAVGCNQDVQPPGAWEILGHYHSLVSVLVVHLHILIILQLLKTNSHSHIVSGYN